MLIFCQDIQNIQSHHHLYQSSKMHQEMYQLQQQPASSSVHPSDITIPGKKHTLDGFFAQKQKEMASKQLSFKKVLDSKQFRPEQQSSKSLSRVSRFSKSNVRKGNQQRQARLRNVIEENKKQLSKLQVQMRRQEQLNQFEKKLLKQEKNSYLNKIEDLQSQIEQLYRQNYRLKQVEKSNVRQGTQKESFNASQFKQFSSLMQPKQPYVIQTRKNDLNRINRKHKIFNHNQEKEVSPDRLGDRLQKEKHLTAQDFFGKKNVNYGLMGEKYPEKKQMANQSSLSFKTNKNQNILQGLLQDNQPAVRVSRSINISSMSHGNHFDTFQLAQTASYINDSVINESRQVARMSAATCTRNKVAFFKSSLVIVRQPDVQIAFKRSQLNQLFNKVRLIFYVNNKSQTGKRVRFNYQYQQEYFKIDVVEKLSEVRGSSQGREVLQITLISDQDLNGVTDVKVQIGEKTYDLWLPVNFINFKKNSSHRMQQESSEMNIVPDRQFASFESLSGVMPAMFGGKEGFENWAYLWGESKFGCHAVRLCWKNHQLFIEATSKWIDFLGFVFHFYK